MLIVSLNYNVVLIIFAWLKYSLNELNIVYNDWIYEKLKIEATELIEVIMTGCNYHCPKRIVNNFWIILKNKNCL